MKDLSGRPAKILSRFPAFMRADKPGKVLGEVALALGRDLDEAERLMAGIQRAHRLDVAEEERDVLGLAALLGLQGADFAILQRFWERGFIAAEDPLPADAQDREAQAYARYLAELRESVQRTVRVMQEGCGTLWALLEGTAILLNADTLPQSGRMQHPDQNSVPHGGFIHRARIKYSVMQDGKPAHKEGHLYLVENPPTDKSTDDQERRQHETFHVDRRGLFNVPTAVQVTGMAGRSVLPMIVNRTNHQGLGFLDALEDGQKLVFAVDGHAYLDGADVTGRCYAFRGALSDDTPFDGVLRRHHLCEVIPPGALDRNTPAAALLPAATLKTPILPLGGSDWRFSVQEGAYDASAFDLAVFALPDDPIELAALPPSGKVRLLWSENEPFAATVLIPADLKSLEGALLDPGEDLLTLLRAGLEKFRAAGTRVNVDYFEDKWVLDASILKDLNANAGEGVDFEGTVFSEPAPA
jgi:hypothetical protein